MFPVEGVVPIAAMQGDDELDHRHLLRMAEQARRYLASFRWCASIQGEYFGDGYGGIAAVFFFQIEPVLPVLDEWLWVIVGDLPWAYLDIAATTKPSEALQRYVDGCETWAKLAKQGLHDPQGAPIRLPATPSNAEELQKRLTFIREIMVPAFKQAEHRAS